MGFRDRPSSDDSPSSEHLLQHYNRSRSAEHRPSLYKQARHVVVKVSRRQVIVLTSLLLLVSLFSQRHQVPRKWVSQNVFSCSSDRAHAKYRPVPGAISEGNSTTFWSDLFKLYEEHETFPKELPRIGTDDGGTTSVEEVRAQTVLTDNATAASHESHQKLLDAIPPYPKNVFSGRGIVMLAGAKYSEFAATSLGMLREVGSKLPIEVWVSEEWEEVDGWCEELEKEGMVCRRLSDFVDVKLLKHPYQFKVFTMLFSSFQEILFLDADNMALQNPDPLFDAPIYNSAGAVLWPDYWKPTASRSTPVVLGITQSPAYLYPDTNTIESGQILWHKERHWTSLVLAGYYNYQGPNFYYTLFSGSYPGWGDKDTFPWALRATGEEFSQIPHGIGTVFQVAGTIVKPGHGIGMIQADPRNETHNVPMFLHTNIIKWSMREFLCTNCPIIWEKDDVKRKEGHINQAKDKEKPLDRPESTGRAEFFGSYVNPNSELYQSLHEHKRILDSPDIAAYGMDPEILIWTAIEWTACRSKAWGADDLCNRTRKHMELTFDFEFKQTKLASAMGGDNICVVAPSEEEHS